MSCTDILTSSRSFTVPIVISSGSNGISKSLSSICSIHIMPVSSSVRRIFFLTSLTPDVKFIVGMPQRSLSVLLQHYCNFEADKRYQRADWRIRPLPDGMLNYARSDTHFLLFIYDNLRNALLHKSSRPSSAAASGTIVLDSAKPNPQEAMREVLDKSAETALKMYERDSYDIETGRGSGGWLAAGKKWLPKGEIEQESGWVWRHLHDWRDRVAREMDESPL